MALAHSGGTVGLSGVLHLGAVVLMSAEGQASEVLHLTAAEGGRAGGMQSASVHKATCPWRSQAGSSSTHGLVGLGVGLGSGSSLRWKLLPKLSTCQDFFLTLKFVEEAVKHQVSFTGPLPPSLSDIPLTLGPCFFLSELPGAWEGCCTSPACQ